VNSLQVKNNRCPRAVQSKALFKESTYMIERIWQTTNLCIIKVFYYNVESLLLFRKETERGSCRSEVSSYFLLIDTLHQSILVIYAPMIYNVVDACGSVFIWYGSGSSILGWIPIRIQGFDTRNWKKFTAEFFSFYQKLFSKHEIS